MRTSASEIIHSFPYYYKKGGKDLVVSRETTIFAGENLLLFLKVILMKETFHQADARFYEAWKYIEVKSVVWTTENTNFDI